MLIAGAALLLGLSLLVLWRAVALRGRLEALVAERTAALEASRSELAARAGELEATRSSFHAADRLAAVGRLSRGIAHEINNPLAIVRANVEFALDELGRPDGSAEESRVALQEACAATLRIGQVVKDLSAFAREPGNDLGPTDLRAVFDRVLRLVRPEVAARARVELAAPVAPLLVKGSAQSLAHVFTRLMLDAAAAYPAGTPLDQALVRVSAARRNAEVVVEVRDDGVPIPPDVLPHVFDPFFKAVPGFTFGECGRGMGVCLSACHGLVEATGGALEVESGGAGGTVFRVVLPIATSDTRLSLSPAWAARPRHRVVVVDEDPMALASIYRLLGGKYQVVPHTSAGHVLALLGAGERFDALVCDLSLRELEASAFHAGVTETAPALASATVFVEPAAGPPPEWVARLPNPRVTSPPGPGLLAALAACLGEGERPPGAASPDERAPGAVA